MSVTSRTDEPKTYNPLLEQEINGSMLSENQDSQFENQERQGHGAKKKKSSNMVPTTQLREPTEPPDCYERNQSVIKQITETLTKPLTAEKVADETTDVRTSSNATPPSDVLPSRLDTDGRCFKSLSNKFTQGIKETKRKFRASTSKLLQLFVKNPSTTLDSGWATPPCEQKPEYTDVHDCATDEKAEALLPVSCLTSEERRRNRFYSFKQAGIMIGRTLQRGPLTDPKALRNRRRAETFQKFN